MAAIQLKQIKKISQRDKDIVYGYIKMIQSIFPEDIPYFTIVQLIQDLCLLYFSVIMDSKILKDELKLKLFEAISNHMNCQSEWQLIFRASKDGNQRDNFYAKCNGIKDTVCIIESPQNNIFGGYNPLRWDKSKATPPYDHENNSSAFVYKITLSSDNVSNIEIFPAQNYGYNAIQHYSDGYLSFGRWGSAFYFDTAGGSVVCSATWNRFGSEEYKLDGYKLNGKESTTFEAKEVEVFQLHKTGKM